MPGAGRDSVVHGGRRGQLRPYGCDGALCMAGREPATAQRQPAAPGHRRRGTRAGAHRSWGPARVDPTVPSRPCQGRDRPGRTGVIGSRGPAYPPRQAGDGSLCPEHGLLSRVRSLERAARCRPRSCRPVPDLPRQCGAAGRSIGAWRSPVLRRTRPGHQPTGSARLNRCRVDFGRRVLDSGARRRPPCSSTATVPAGRRQPAGS